MKNCLSCQHCEFHHEYDSGVNVVEAKCLKEHQITTEFQSEHYSGVQEHYGAIAQNCSDFEFVQNEPSGVAEVPKGFKKIVASLREFQDVVVPSDSNSERDRQFVQSMNPSPEKRRASAIAKLAKEMALTRISSGEDFDLHSVEKSFALAEIMIDKMIAIGADIYLNMR